MRTTRRLRSKNEAGWNAPSVGTTRLVKPGVCVSIGFGPGTYLGRIRNLRQRRRGQMVVFIAVPALDRRFRGLSAAVLSSNSRPGEQAPAAVGVIHRERMH